MLSDAIAAEASDPRVKAPAFSRRPSRPLQLPALSRTLAAVTSGKQPGWNMHTGADVCIDDFQANRAPDKRYRTAPLGGLFTHQKGGFYHDGRFATLNDVVDHYNSCMKLGLSADEKSDLIAYLLTL